MHEQLEWKLHIGLAKWMMLQKMSKEVYRRAGESRSEARGNISFEGPIGPKIRAGEGGGVPLRLACWAPYYILGPLLYLGARSK